MRLKGNYAFKGYRLSQWVKILAINFKENRFMRFIPLKVIINDILPLRTYPLNRLIDRYLIGELINNDWTKEDKEKFLIMLRDFLKTNFNKEVKL
jgi:hypothetical protein